MKEQDYSKITLQEAFTWVDAQCRFEHNRKRLRSRAVAYILAKEVLRLMEENKVLKDGISKVNELNKPQALV